MAHVDLDEDSQRKCICVRDPMTEEEFGTLVKAFAVLLQIDQETNGVWKQDAVGESNCNSVASENK